VVHFSSNTSVAATSSAAQPPSSSGPLVNSPQAIRSSASSPNPALVSLHGLGIGIGPGISSGSGLGIGPGNGIGPGIGNVPQVPLASLGVNVPPQEPLLSHASTLPCEMTMKDLLSLHQDYDDFKGSTPLTPLSPCPICNLKVGRHKFSRSTTSASRTVRQASVSAPEQVDDADDLADNRSVGTHVDHPDDGFDHDQVPVALSSVRSNPPLRDFSRQFDKALSRIPPWSKNNTHASGCREFLEGVEYALEIFGVPQDQWYRILPLVFEKGDYASARYVKTHITGPHPISLDWDEAKLLFTSHFQRADFVQVIERDFGTCRQRPRESVQLYADRFMSFCEDLNIEDSSTQAISKFTNGLLDVIRKK